MIKKIILFIFCIPLTMHAMQITQQEREQIVTELNELAQEILATAKTLKEKFIDLNSSEKITQDIMKAKAPQIDVTNDFLEHYLSNIETKLRQYINPPESCKDTLIKELLKHLDHTKPLDKKVFDIITENNKLINPYLIAINNELAKIKQKCGMKE